MVDGTPDSRPPFESTAVRGAIDVPMPPREAMASALVRRTRDIAIALLGLLLIWPLLWWIAWRIRRESPGDAIFAQTRAGRAGRPFTIYKFRTMRTDADPYGHSPHSAEDPRLTEYGRWLREKSLDELPQLWNVLRGDMTLVGPRPLYVSQIEEWDDRQRLRLCVKPGLTGMAQVHGRGGLPMEDKLEMDVQYVLRRSLWLDACLMWRTIRTPSDPADVYEKRYSRAERVRGESKD
jgi:lipopolysaccharide/colanic/teichoic acid biosynthesis glycosyltransferase